MRIPKIHGIIRRRLLVNFRANRDVVQRILPQTFKPKLQGGYAVVGICLIRLEQIRPKGFPRLIGLSSENAAHRIAVRWMDQDGEAKEGVFIPRRDTGSVLNALAGGRLFPGEHHRASFSVREESDHIDLQLRSADGQVDVRVSGRVAASLSASSIFSSVEEASKFFEPGSLGYSATSENNRLDGVILKTHSWHVEPLEVEDVYSSVFANEKLFPAGSIAFDSALIMRDIEHEWHPAAEMYL